MLTGIDNLLANPAAILKNRNFCLVTGSSNIDSSLIPVFWQLKKIAAVKMKAIWSLQHGFFIDKQDNMIFSQPFFHSGLDLRIESLYQNKLLPEENWLKDIDALVIDIFDVGTRVYTFANHLIKILKFLSGRKIDIIVLDRPNPLNGITAEGSISKKEYFSIVAEIPVPMRHALTCAELLNYALSYHKIDLELETVLVKGWHRQEYFHGIWTYPSPNMPSFATALVYPGAVLLEGTNISEGRGTTRPFEFIGAPFLDNTQLAQELQSLALPGVDFIPQFFKPEFSKFSQQICHGILVHPNDVDAFRSFATYYEIIRLIREMHPGKFNWQQPPYEFEFKRLPVDMITGSDFIRNSIENNIPYFEIEPVIKSEIADFQNLIARHLLY